MIAAPTPSPVTPWSKRPPLLAVALISAAALAYEVLLVRIFSVIQWHHFASMIISLALLGFGASGTFLALVEAPLLRRFPHAFTASSMLFSLTACGSLAATRAVPFSALQIFWDFTQWLRLMALYLLLMIPFFFAANCIALALDRYRRQTGSVYAADLLGAGAGSLGVVGLLLVLPPDRVLTVVAAIGALAGAAAWVSLGARPVGAAIVPALLAVALVTVVPQPWLRLEMSPYKPLAQTMEVAGSQVIATRSSPLGSLSVVRGTQVPLRYAPGLSLNASRGPPPQIGIFSDGEGPSVITRFTGDWKALAYLDWTTSALPYHLLRAPHVLVLGAGGGTDVLQALAHGAARTDAVELNAQVVELVRRDFADFAGHLFSRSDVRVHVAEARAFLAGRSTHYDLIELALLDSFNASAAGLHALSASHLYTVEALREYLSHLRPGGILAITRWVKVPPRDGIKLFATAVRALAQSGLDPRTRLVWIRGWSTSTLLVRNEAFTATELAAVRAFCTARSFDTAYYPGMPAAAANRYNRLEHPWFFAAARALLGPAAQRFLENYKFDVAPTTDDRPYFFDFFKWKTLPEILRLREVGGAGLFDAGYLILVATLCQALIAAAAFILLPLLWRRTATVDQARPPARRGTVFAYFTALGLAFLFLEMAFIEKLTLFLGDPLYATAVVLAGFLVFAGLGSRLGASHPGTGAARRVVHAVAGIVVLGGAYVLGLPPLLDHLLWLPVPFRMGLSLAVVAPLAFCMGMPFPLGLSALTREPSGLIPWAWAVNGCASVASAALATLLAVHLGLHAVILVGLVLYGLAAALAPRLCRATLLS